MSLRSSITHRFNYTPFDPILHRVWSEMAKKLPQDHSGVPIRLDCIFVNQVAKSDVSQNFIISSIRSLQLTLIKIINNKLTNSC